MSGRRALAALAATGMIALIATACGSSAPQAFHPAGKASAAPNPSASLANFPFPPDIHIDFQSALPADPQQAAAVTTDRDFQLAFYYAQYTQGKDRRYEQYLAPGTTPLLIEVQSNVTPYATDHKSIRGTLRLYDTTVQPVQGAPQALSVTQCVDDSKLPDVDARSGKVIPGSPRPSAYYILESDTFKPLGSGRWGLAAIAITVYPQGNAKECKP